MRLKNCHRNQLKPTRFINIPELIQNGGFSHLLIITPIFADEHKKICKKNILHVLQNIKRESRKGELENYIMCCGISTKNKILSVPFFFLSLTSNFNFYFLFLFFSGRFQFLSWCYVDSPYVYFFFLGND